MNRLKRYNFTDDLGHPLELCREYIAIHSDYAALEPLCAGLERELTCAVAESNMRKSLMAVMSEQRDALKLSLDESHADFEERRKEMEQWREWCVEARQERDALQAKLAAAEEAFAELYEAESDYIKSEFTISKFKRWDLARNAARNARKSITILAGHASATKGEGDE